MLAVLGSYILSKGEMEHILRRLKTRHLPSRKKSRQQVYHTTFSTNPLAVVFSWGKCPPTYFRLECELNFEDYCKTVFNRCNRQRYECRGISTHKYYKEHALVFFLYFRLYMRLRDLKKVYILPPTYKNVEFTEEEFMEANMENLLIIL